MRKPTERQCVALRLVAQEFAMMPMSNDLHSPSHGTSIELIGHELEEEHGITEQQADQINDAIKELWSLIANLDTPTR